MNAERLAILRRNAGKAEFAEAVADLRAAAERTMAIAYDIGAGEQALWGHYYYCEDGTALTFDWSRRHEHVCPQCGKTYRGPRYDGAWLTHAHHLIGSGLKGLGFMVWIGGEGAQRYAERIRGTLLDYARHYESYAVHGGIPYNGPGKLYDQTLDEAHWIMELIFAYLSVGDHLPEAERTRIMEGLFRPCAAFLIGHKEPQLHNHAVLITAAISMLGFLLGDEEIHSAGRNGEFGLLDQLERGVLPDGFWYEGVFLYHFFAFAPVLSYCLLTEGTSRDLREHPAMRKMFDFPLDYLLADGTFPAVNDLNEVGYKGAMQSYAWCYEVACGWYADDKYREYLRIAYGVNGAHRAAFPDAAFAPVRRGSSEALLYGAGLAGEGVADGEASLAARVRSNASSAGSGLTKLVNRNGWTLVSKTSPFGGEHDHMDRLGLSLTARGGAPLFADVGTTAYGVPVHYGWFKHTYAHNTVNIDGKDQPPADARLVRYAEETWGGWLEGAVDWRSGEYYVKDKIALPADMRPWDDAAYRGVAVRRVHALTDDWLLDAVRVDAPRGCRVGLNWHIAGRLADTSGWSATEAQLGDLAQQWLTDKLAMQPAPRVGTLVWQVQDGLLAQAYWCSHPTNLYAALTPDNPPLTSRQSLIAETETPDAAIVTFVNVFACGGEAKPSGKLRLRVEAGATDAGTAVAAGAGAVDKLVLTLLADERQTAQFRLVWHETGAQLLRLG